MAVLASPQITVYAVTVPTKIVLSEGTKVTSNSAIVTTQGS